MLRTVVEYVATLTKGLEVTRTIIRRIMV